MSRDAVDDLSDLDEATVAEIRAAVDHQERRELQRLAKLRGIKANQKTQVLVEELGRRFSGELDQQMGQAMDSMSLNDAVDDEDEDEAGLSGSQSDDEGDGREATPAGDAASSCANSTAAMPTKTPVRLPLSDARCDPPACSAS